MQDVKETLTEERAAVERLSPWREWFFRVVPAFDSLRTYSVEVLGLDTMAGLTVAAVAVPQAMAYAQIAGIPPQYGLYTAIVMTGVGALFDSSKQLINGPTNAISIALLSALTLVADHERVAAAILLAFLVGVIQLGSALVRLGELPAGVRVYSIPATRIAEELGKKMVLNIVMVGFFGAITQVVEREALRNAVGDSVPSAYRDLNLKAFDRGYEYGIRELKEIIVKQESEVAVGALEN